MTPITGEEIGFAVLGGVLIGASAVLLMLLNGRIAGISGIVGEALTGPSDDRTWRLAFIAGLLIAPFGFYALGQDFEVSVPHSLPLVILGGLFVGFGTRLGGGCTSGHGVCGMSRFSVRSITATITFMAVGVLTVFVLHHLLGIGG